MWPDSPKTLVCVVAEQAIGKPTDAKGPTTPQGKRFLAPKTQRFLVDGRLFCNGGFSFGGRTLALAVLGCYHEADGCAFGAFLLGENRPGGL